jgi:Flp pilus assembly protein TadG
LTTAHGSGRRQAGAAVIETSLLLPLFLAFWFGIIDWGLAFFVHETVVHQTQKAARWASLNNYDATKIRNVLLYNDPTINRGGAVWFSLQNPTVTVNLRGIESWNTQRIVITISNYQWMHFTPFLSGRYLGRPITVSTPIEDLKTGS